ncbi:hypothetical protein M5689_011384 [Euphorbia peplus]|nr:hypothetical protein M5689_011384 [Euphorbia peplus]
MGIPSKESWQHNCKQVKQLNFNKIHHFLFSTAPATEVCSDGPVRGGSESDEDRNMSIGVITSPEMKEERRWV